jgi:lipoate-protein ligase A
MNMAADEALARRSEETNSVLMRLYGWQPHTVSLGCFQKMEDFSRASFLAHWPVVRRPSGGGAIIHGTDITYGLAVPSSHKWSKRTEDLYSAVHGALVQELNDRDLKATMVEAARREQDQNFYCFNRRAFGDLVVEHSLASSASAVTVRFLEVRSEGYLALSCNMEPFFCVEILRYKVREAIPGLGICSRVKRALYVMLLKVGCNAWQINLVAN